MMGIYPSLGLCGRIVFMMVLLLSGTSQLQAANITDADCAVGGVKAGWRSTHHYLPEKFNGTGLKEVNWLKSNVNIPLDNYPKSYVVGFGGVPCERITIDNTIALYGSYTEQSHAYDEGLFKQIFEKNPLYISCIIVAYSNNMNHSFATLATDLQTPRGIKLLSSVNDVVSAYGKPDFITQGKSGTGEFYWYYTPQSLQVRKRKQGYLGACIAFYIRNNAVYQIRAFNTYGYPRNY